MMVGGRRGRCKGGKGGCKGVWDGTGRGEFYRGVFIGKKTGGTVKIHRQDSSSIVKRLALR